MKIIITESQFKTLLTESIAADTELRDSIKSFESTVVDQTGNHYVFDDKDSKTPKTFVVSDKQKKGGKLTIGWGHTGQEAKIGNKISNSKAEELLTKDLTEKENIAKNVLFPKYGQYPLYVQRALINAIYRGEAKTSYEWVKAINSGDWDLAAKKYLEGWDIDFSQANDPKYKGGVADRMVKNQEVFKKYANELKGGTTKKTATVSKPPQPKTQKYMDPNMSFDEWQRKYMFNRTLYPTKRSESNYVNLRNSPEVNNGYIDNKIGVVKWPNPVGIVKGVKDTGELFDWYWVKLDPSVDAEDEYAWVYAKYVTTDKNAKYV